MNRINGAESEELALLKFRLRVLHEHIPILQNLASHIAHIGILLEYILASIQGLLREYDSIAKSNELQIHIFQDILDEHIGEGDAFIV